MAILVITPADYRAISSDAQVWEKPALTNTKEPAGGAD